MPSSFFQSLFEQNYIPHGVCLLWQPGLLWLHVLSDAVIALSYYTIPFALNWFVTKRRDLAFRGISFSPALSFWRAGLRTSWGS